jgi:hypothetical protein
MYSIEGILRVPKNHSVLGHFQDYCNSTLEFAAVIGLAFIFFQVGFKFPVARAPPRPHISTFFISLG